MGGLVHSQGKDPRTPDAPVTRWRVQKKTKRKEVEKEEEENKKKVKHRRNLWWTKRKEQFANFLVLERKEEDLEKKGRERNKSFQDETISGKIWKMALPSLDSDAEWFCVDAAAVRLEPQSETEVPEIIIVSDAVESTVVNLHGKSLPEEEKGMHQREWKRSKGVE